jgi:uncharacterized protein (TIGR03435 family)
VTPHDPPRLAVYLLERFLPDNEPLTGDLVEAARVRSNAWVWRQAILAILARTLFHIETHKRMTIEAALVSTAMLVLIAFHAVVAANLLGRVLPLARAAPGTTAPGVHWTVSILVFAAAVAAGRAIGRFHREHRIAAVLAFSATAVAAAFVNLYLFVPRDAAQSFMPDAALQIAAAAMFVAGLFIGIASRPVPHVAAVVGLMLAATLDATLSAQAGTPRFDVASIKRNVTGNQQGSGLTAPQPGGRYIAMGATLRRLVQDAYDVQVVGGPAWVDSDRFDVNARAEGEPPPAEIRRMLRPLLADRFKLATHVEPREMAVYTLLLARADRKTGEKLQQSDARCAAEARAYFPGAGGSPPPCGDFRLGARQLVARGMTMSGLARVLAGRVGRPVIDKTALDEVFDLELEWSTDLGLRQAPPDSAGAGELRPDGVSLFTALQEQLGLRLESGRAPIDVLVIDRAEPPTEN